MVTKRTDYTAEAVEAARSVMLELTRLLGEVRHVTHNCIPGATRRGSEGGLWVNGLPGVERQWWTGACR